MRCQLLILVNESVFEMKLKRKLQLFGISEENMYGNKNLFDRDSKFKICLRPGLGAQKVEKHCTRAVIPKVWSARLA